MAGIHTITAADVAQFTAHGLVCKLMAGGSRTEAGYSVCVQPTLVKEGSLEAAVPRNYNLITLEGGHSGPMSFYGQGAGRYPTAYNVVQDLVDVQLGKGFYTAEATPVSVDNSRCLRWYVRGGWDGQIRERWGDGVITPEVFIAVMLSWRKVYPEAFIAALADQE